MIKILNRVPLTEKVVSEGSTIDQYLDHGVHKASVTQIIQSSETSIAG